jgi:anaerobic magnesium-protoporphyrin IX monomethyl ester cyclase
MHLDLIVGLPLEYWNDLKFSFESVFKLFPPELQLGFLKFLKGTPVREKYEQYGYEFDPMPPYQIIKSNFLSESELQQITLLEHALEVYWNKKRACHTLRYITSQYSIFDFLLGLGKLFADRHNLHRYNINDVFAVLKEFIDENYAHDPVVSSMLALDYYTYFTVKPKDIGLAIWDKKLTNQFVITHTLNHHKNRYVIVPVYFNPVIYLSQKEVVPARDILVIEYNNQEKGNCLLSLKPKAATTN